MNTRRDKYYVRASFKPGELPAFVITRASDIYSLWIVSQGGRWLSILFELNSFLRPGRVPPARNIEAAAARREDITAFISLPSFMRQRFMIILVIAPLNGRWRINLRLMDSPAPL